MHSIVLTDPAGDFKEGDVLDQTNARVVEARRGVVLPFRPEFAKRNPLAGYYRRGLGAGVKPSHSIYDYVARGALYLAKAERTLIHCGFRLVPTGEAIRGELRLASDTGQGQVNSGTIGINSPVRLVQEVLGWPDSEGGWTVKTSAPVTVAHEGAMCLGLYGNGSGVRIEWIAFSQAD